MRRTIQIFCLSEALSPITQARGTAGNESLINRELVATPLGERYVPTLSGNAIRHQIREFGSQFLMDRMGWSGKMNERRLNFMFGGGSLTEGGGRENTDLIADLPESIPLFSLLGGCLPNQMLRGRMKVASGTLVCAENQDRLRHLSPYPLPDELVLRDSDAFVGTYQYVRNDAVGSVPQHLNQDSRDSRRKAADEGKYAGSDQMIFSGQTIIPGACFIHGFILPNASDLEIGCLLLALSYWIESGNTIGGKGNIGHGRLQTTIKCDPDIEVAGLMFTYAEHVEASRGRADAWMDKAFPFTVPGEDDIKVKKGGKHVKS
jgi:hypothetical protein